MEFTFADTLNDLLIENGITPSILSQATHITVSSISRYLTKSQNPAISESIKIADYFNCTLDYLFGLEENNTQKMFRPCPEFGEHFNYLLNHFHKTVFKIAKDTQIAKSAMYYWKSGERKPTMDSIIKLAKYFDCPIDFVVGRVEFI